MHYSLTAGFENLTIAHEIPGRIRLRAPVLGAPSLDTTLLESHISSIDGVTKVRLNQHASSMTVFYDNSRKTRDSIIDTLKSIDFSVFTAEETLSNAPDKTSLYCAISAHIMRMLLPPLLRPAVTLIGALPVLLSGADTLVNQGLKVEVLDATVISMLLLKGDYLTASWLNFMLTLGHYLEESTEHKSDRLLKSLVKNDIEEIWIIDGSTEKKVTMKEVRVGDTVIVGPGEMIPVDGILKSGEGLINQASLTGESLPVNPKTDDQVYSGTVVIEGKLYIQAVNVGSETTTARIAKFISNSLKNNSNTETQAFKMADKMVPVTFGAGLGVFALTGSIQRASSVLSVDYSCALKLVTPTAMKASMFKAGSEGILIKGAQALENLAAIDTVIFDKTGTLTRGNLAVKEIISYNGYNEEEVLKIAASAEEHYAHPIANAVVSEARKRGIEPVSTGEVDFIIAHGVSAYVEDQEVMVGSFHFIAEDEGIECSHAEEKAQQFRNEGQSVLYVAIEGRLSGIISLRDEIREEAMDAICALKEQGVKRVVMLTGDHKEAALEIGRKLVIDDVYYDLKPEDKASIVKKLSKEGHTSAFVGDGVNDAPALLSANVGVSLPQGADLARETAQVMLLRDNLMGLAIAKQIADKTMQVINQVYKANVGVNSATIILSLLGFLTPLQSSLIHNGTTISTLLYALGLSSKSGKGNDNYDN